MNTVVALETPEGEEISFLIEQDTTALSHLTQTKGGVDHTIDADNKVVTTFGAYFDPVRRLANQLSNKIKEIETKPEKVEISVGIKLTAEAGIIFAKASSDAEMNIKLTWAP